MAGDIAQAISKIQRYVASLDYERFLADSMVQDAVVRNLEIVGEAARNLSAGFKMERRTTDWKAIAGMRDRLIHGYSGVNWKIVWDVVTVELPKLKAALKGPARNPPRTGA